MTARSHKESASLLLFISMMIAAICFTIFRIFGVEYFLAIAPQFELEPWQGMVILTAFFMFERVNLLRAMVEVSFKKAIIIIAVVTIITFIVDHLAGGSVFILDLFLIISIPLMLQINKLKRLPYCIVYVGVLNAYQLSMVVFARNYPEYALTNPVWVIFGTIDYYLFVYLLHRNKTRVDDFIGRFFNKSKRLLVILRQVYNYTRLYW